MGAYRRPGAGAQFDRIGPLALLPESPRNALVSSPLLGFSTSAADGRNGTHSMNSIPTMSQQFSPFVSRLAAGMLLLAIAAGAAHAQSLAADGGALRNNLERNLPQPALPDVAPRPSSEPPKAAAETGDKVTVSRFRFIGNTLLSDRALARSVELYLNRPIDFAELQNAAAMAALAYRDKGYVATVSIPRQDIEDGIVTLKVVEAKYAGASLDGSSNGRINSELILARVEKAMGLEKAVNINVLDRTLLLINDLPGASVQGGLAEGESDGETRVVLQSQQKPVVTGTVNMDTYGSRSTGAERLLIDVALNSPTGRGEQYTLGMLATEGVKYGRGGFSVPVGLDGARLGLSGSAMSYQVIAGATAPSDLHGDSTTAGADLSYPLVRSQQANLFLSGSVVGKWFDNYSGSRLTRNYESTAATLAVSGNWVDAFFGGASNQASLSVTSGELRIKDQQSRAADALTAKTDGGFNKLNGAISRSQAVLDWMSFVLSFSGQFAWNNLDSSEKFFLGGPSGVRAYPVSEGGGSNGQLTTAELRMKLPRNWELRLFHDQGRVKQYVDEFRDMSYAPNVLSYRGYGASLIWQGPRNMTITATLARRIDDNPLPDTATGNDQDGTKKMNRLWLAASIPF